MGSRWPTSGPATSFGTRSCRTSWRRTASSESSVPASMADDDQPPLIALDDRQSDGVDLEGLMTLARATLLCEGIADAELSISLVTEEEMAELHERYLHEAGPTDVLSFPLDDGIGGRAPAARGRRDRPGGRRAQQPRRSGGRAPAPARARDPASARPRPHGASRAGFDVVAAGALFGDPRAVSGGD